MNKEEWERLFREAIYSLQQQPFVPYDTGNLKYGAIKGIWKDENTFTIYIDENVAPYVFFTNETWSMGRNPHEHWIDEMVDYISRYIARKLKGGIKK